MSSFKKEEVYLIKNIEEFGKLMAFCIENDICIFRTYWNEKEKGKRIYHIDWQEKRCYYSSGAYYQDESRFKIVIPNFVFNEYGTCKLESVSEVQK